MVEASNPPSAQGEGNYVELGGENTPPTTQFLDIVRRVLQELAIMRTIHELMDGEGDGDKEDPMKRKSDEIETKTYESGDESNFFYLRIQRFKKKNKMELQGKFKKIRPTTFDGKSDEDVELWFLNII